VAWPVVSTGFDYLIAIDDEPAREAMRALAGEGVVAGETGAAALAGLTELLGGEDAPELRDRLDLGPDARALVLCTEGATDPKAYAEIVGGG
jgi:diaminopropionate ammonia-lyase